MPCAVPSPGSSGGVLMHCPARRDASPPSGFISDATSFSPPHSGCLAVDSSTFSTSVVGTFSIPGTLLHAGAAHLLAIPQRLGHVVPVRPSEGGARSQRSRLLTEQLAREDMDVFLTHKGFLGGASHPGHRLGPQRGQWAKLPRLDSRKASVLGVTKVQERSPSL